MVVTEGERRMITARRYPCIVLITAHVDERNVITLSAPDLPDIATEIPIEISDNIETEVDWKQYNKYQRLQNTFEVANNHVEMILIGSIFNI